MTILAICLAVAGWGAAFLFRDRLIALPSPGLMATNFRGKRIPAIGGPVLILSLLSCAGILALVAAFAPFPTDLAEAIVLSSQAQAGIMLIAVGFFGLGLLDDISDGTGAKGVRGHLVALKQGDITSGAIKAVGGLGLAFFVSALWEASPGPAILGALIISTSANLLNLLDLRPGRACKFYLLAWIPLAWVGVLQAPFVLPLSAGVAGAAAGWLPSDLGEEAILGDSGSNLLGGVMGAGVVLAAGPITELVLLALLLVLTAASEKYSFTTAIAGFAPLRWFDRLGRAPE